MKLVSYALAAAVAAAMGLYVIDGARVAVERINAATSARCDAYNSVLPGACELP